MKITGYPQVIHILWKSHGEYSQKVDNLCTPDVDKKNIFFQDMDCCDRVEENRCFCLNFRGLTLHSRLFYNERAVLRKTVLMGIVVINCR